MAEEKATNIVVMNQGLNPLVNYNFMLRVEGVFDLPCKTVHSFTKENEYEYIQEGGLNDYVHMRRKPITKPFTFTVERYVGTDYYDPLQNGTELTLPVILMITRYGNHFEVTKRAYVFTGCTVMSKEYGELNSERSGLHTEKIVIGYREMMVVTMPGDIPIGKWDINKDKTKNKFAKEAPDTGVTDIRQSLPIRKKRKKITDKEDFQNLIGIDVLKERKELLEKIKKLMNKVKKKNKFARKWPKVASAKPTIDKGKPIVRQWPKVKSAKPSVETGDAEIRKWPNVNSAEPSVETGDAKIRKLQKIKKQETERPVARRVLPIEKGETEPVTIGIRKGLPIKKFTTVNKNVFKRQWPPTKSAKSYVVEGNNNSAPEINI